MAPSIEMTPEYDKMKIEAILNPTPTSAADGVEVRHFRLLALPTELQLMIYGFCLLREERIEITSIFRQPALLSTCREIRAATRPIFYLQNRFRLPVYHCDDRLIIPFLYLPGGEYQDAFRSSTTLKIVPRGHGNWNNLMEWCRRVHLWKAGFVSNAPGPAEITAVIAVGHSIALAAESWERCKRPLRAFKRTARRLHSDWY